jgi:photosystem II stability/assembly factor-like uncharacterized protein
MDSAVSGLRFDLTAHVVQFRGSSQRKSPYGTIHLLLSVGLIIGAPGNASASWIEQSVNSPELLAVVQAVNHQVAWAVGNDARVVVTSDGGASWIPRTVPGAMNVRGLFAFDDQVAVVSDQFGSFWRTTNGGVLWTHVHGPTGMSINGIHFFDNQNGWAMGDPINGHYVILLSTNGGVSWIASPNAPPGTAFATVGSYD